VAAAPDVALRGSVVASIVGKSVELVTLALLATVVPRVLGPDDYGRFSVPLTIVTLGSLAMTLGGPTLLARFVPAAPPGQQVAVARAIGARLARGRAAQLAVVAVVAAVAVAVDGDRFSPGETPIVVIALALNVAAGLALQVGLGLGRTVAWSARFPLQNAVLIVAALTLDGDALAVLLAAVAAAAFGAWVVLPVMRAPDPAVPVPDGAIRFGVLQAAGAAMVQVAHRGGVLVVAVLAASAAETGYAALAIGIALGVTYAVLQAFTVTLPHLTERPDAEAALRRLAGGMLAVLVPGAILTAIVLDDVVPLVFGDDYLAATAAFVPAVALVVLAPINALAVQVAALRLRPDAAFGAGLAAVAAFGVVAIATVPAWDASGATFAALAGTAASALVSLVMLPGAIGARLAAASFAGAAIVLAVA
jgi:O-antigen/teichoic acid export membrane protein